MHSWFDADPATEMAGHVIPPFGCRQVEIAKVRPAAETTTPVDI